MDVAIRAAGVDDLDGIVDVLTDAFTEDPLMTWAFPDPATRRLRISGLWRFMAREGYLPHGASAVAPGPDAAALWLPPGEELDDEFWSSHAGLFMEMVDGDVERLSAMSELMDAHHPRDDHWYLLAIGVSSARQGGRLGSALLAHTLATADEQGMPAYLEATSPRSRALYERFGFEATAELVVADSPPMWAMWRPPDSRAPGSTTSVG